MNKFSDSIPTSMPSSPLISELPSVFFIILKIIIEFSFKPNYYKIKNKKYNGF